MQVFEAKAVSAGYIHGSLVLKDLALWIKRGETVLITGFSGSGKTTLIFAATGVLKHLLGGHVEGWIRVNGIDPLTPEGFERLPGRVGLLLQDPERQLVFPTPIDELYYTYLALGVDEKQAYENALMKLKEAGLIGYERRHIEDLSTGMRKRIALSLVEAGNPVLIILDEPSANLDPDGVRAVRDIIARSKRANRGVLIVEHKPHLFSDLVDKMYVLQGGKLVESIIEEESMIKQLDCRERESVQGEIIVKAHGDIGYRDTVVLRDIYLEAKRGEIIVITGPNGSGKSTLLKTIAGFIKPLSGGIEIKTKRFFYAPQNPDQVFVHTTVKKEIASTSRRTGIPLEELVDKYPWYTRVQHMSPYQLSHGQRRLLELLIAFSYGKDLVLLDEPSTGLDPSLFTHLVKELHDYTTRGGTAIIATHDPRLVLEASRVYAIAGGTLKEVDKCSSHESMIRSSGVR